ncbi:MAG TPA: tetratricopeptide repeat protein [Candidatus Hydrogenedentes bacterium]|nr:tetratricopeptide repeat protein [Candidatus Hydrogenedentota bacterium]HIJ73036.1 tetratricopeptide repeat protein [Candidatus Hydrogenedentota bacterium]
MENAQREVFRDVLISVLLVAGVAAIFAQVLNHDFVSYDDPGYVYENPDVKGGISRPGILWALTTFSFSNWHPLTWLSHMLDCSVYGLHAPGHLVTNVILHAANAALLFWVLKRASGAPWRSAFAAGLFAVHPLRVESVAWVAERKDVLSGLFWMLTLLAYTSYARRRTARAYIAVVLLFALGLMSKPVMVTLPFVLLLLDYWPFRRAPFIFPVKRQVVRVWARLLGEKIPLFLLVAAACCITIAAQRRGNAIKPLEQFPADERAANAAVAYTEYMRMAFWPKGLAVFYPHPKDTLPVWRVAASALLLAGISGAVLAGRRRGYLPVGWFWYLGVLIPVIGVVQVGEQAFADRYTYLPFIGLFVIVAWGVPDLVGGWRHARRTMAAAGTASLSVLAVCAWMQTGYWRDSRTLYERALAVTKGNHLAHYNLGNLCNLEGRPDEAEAHYREAIRIKPYHLGANTNLGLLLSEQGKHEEAERCFERAIRTSPDDFRPRFNLANTLLSLGRVDEAVECYRQTLELCPANAGILVNLGNALSVQGKLYEACQCFQEAARIDPDNVNAHFNLGNTWQKLGRLREAAGEFAHVLQLDPNDLEARQILESLQHEMTLD